jgi:nitroimidazol reductase NimA-like FMN-containing flavoprotein (pyridoxamine 5'-phosphate oxidase superfamily)
MIMDEATRQQILEIMDTNNICTLATARDDGYPQATTVAYVHDGLTIYLCCDPEAQKLKNIRHCNKVSLTIDHDYADWNQIRGISLGGLATEVNNQEELEHVLQLMVSKFPSITDMDMPEDMKNTLAVVRISPQVISLLDYRKGFGHTEYITV